MAEMTLQERFEQKFQPVPWSGCWVWTAATKEHGYGVIGIGSRKQGTMKAHRLSYTLYKGDIPEDCVVMHLCNNPSCVNPDHLEAGTRKQNQRYMVDCGRLKVPNNQGEKSVGAKLTEESALEIKRAYADRGKHTATGLAKKFGVSRAAIYEIWRGKNWTWLTDAK
jgi:hypothetical protein